MKKNKYPITSMISPEVKKRSFEVAKDLKVSFSVLSEAALKKVNDEHAFIKESVELQGKTPEEAEREFLEFWGLA